MTCICPRSSCIESWRNMLHKGGAVRWAVLSCCLHSIYSANSAGSCQAASEKLNMSIYNLPVSKSTTDLQHLANSTTQNYATHQHQPSLPRSSWKPDLYLHTDPSLFLWCLFCKMTWWGLRAVYSEAPATCIYATTEASALTPMSLYVVFGCYSQYQSLSLVKQTWTASSMCSHFYKIGSLPCACIYARSAM